MVCFYNVALLLRTSEKPLLDILITYDCFSVELPGRNYFLRKFVYTRS